MVHCLSTNPMSAPQSNPPANLNASPVWRKIMQFYRVLKPGIAAMRLPLLGPVLQKSFLKEKTDSNWFIPINAALPQGQSCALPGALVADLLRQADGIFAMSACPCRTAFHCQFHPADLGCLHLGPAARQIPPDVGRLLNLQEGLTHLDRALASGLIPTILHQESEAKIFGVEKTRMLSLCFCCECCCDVRLLLRQGPQRYWDSYNHRLPGLSIVVDERCTLCGACVSACYGGNAIIKLGLHKAEIDERCIGCGRCIPACPQEALSLHLDPDTDLMENLLVRISERVQIRASS
jgi:NAD-dependent dihydropyrimidine dehydrogenase PreA subunit